MKRSAFFTEPMKEKPVEERLRKRVKELQGRAFKFVSPGNAGVPDRIILLPGARIVFVETKAPGKKPRPTQRAQIEFIRSLGFRVEVIDTPEKADRLAEELGASIFWHLRPGRKNGKTIVEQEMRKRFMETHEGHQGTKANVIIFDEMAEEDGE